MTDHALQMHRQGIAAGHLGRGASREAHVAAGGYLPGRAASGKEDTRPVTDAELEKAHYRIRMMVNTKFATMRRAFRKFDFDHSGMIDRPEALRILMELNLTGIREAVLLKLVSVAGARVRETFRPAFCNELVKRQDKNCARPDIDTRNRLLATLARDVPSLSERVPLPSGPRCRWTRAMLKF